MDGLAKLTQPTDSSELDATVAQGTEPGMVMGTMGYMSPETSAWKDGRPPLRHLRLRHDSLRNGDGEADVSKTYVGGEQGGNPERRSAVHFASRGYCASGFAASGGYI